VNVRKTTFSYGMEKNVLFNKSLGPIYELNLLRTQIKKNGKWLQAVAMASLE
jgi:hypothetical protein